MNINLMFDVLCFVRDNPFSSFRSINSNFRFSSSKGYNFVNLLISKGLLCVRIELSVKKVFISDFGLRFINDIRPFLVLFS